MRRHHKVNIVSSALLVCACSVTSATTIVLYDDTIGNLPGDQTAMVYFGLGSVSQSAVPEGVNFITGAATQAGFTATPGALPELDAAVGFSIDFELQIHEETHSSVNRAGFSVILLGNDRRGVELAFWEDEIWAQGDSPLFTHAEGVVHNTTDQLTTYTLQLAGGQYEVFADGLPILSGSTKDYTPFTGLIDPYEIPNYLFLGDDTSSAAANITLGEVRLNTCCFPEPHGNLMALLGVIAVLPFRRRGSFRFLAR